jgi:hypothetical protein
MELVTLLSCIRKVLGSSLSLNNDYSPGGRGGFVFFLSHYSIWPVWTGILALLSEVFRSFPQSLQANTRIVPELNHYSKR